MRNTPRTTTTSRAHRSARLRGWLLLRALTLGPAIGILLGSPAAVGLTADAVAASPAHKSVAVTRVEAATPPSTGAGVFGGFTSKGGPVVVEVTGNGKQIKRVVAGIELRCSSGNSFMIADKWTQLPIRGSHFAASFSDTFVEDGQSYEVSDSIKGKLNRRRTRISGSWRSRLVVRNSAGATIDTCDSGPLRFTARR